MELIVMLVEFNRESIITTLRFDESVTLFI